MITSFVNNIYLGQKYGFHTVMLSSLCNESMEVWAWESQPVVMSELSPSYQGILAPGFWIRSFSNITWTSLYSNIRACNVFFENVESHKLEGSTIDRLKGEVHFLRAYFYFWLMSQWGGVPLIEKVYKPSDDLLVARNTFEETVDFIVKDLDAAAAELPLTGDKARLRREQLVESFEMADGSKFSWDNPTEAAQPYKNRDPRFYATILYDGAKWRQRPDDVIGSDPEGIVQTGFYEQKDGSYTAGLDTRQGPVEDWNGTYTGYYMRKFIDPAINHQYDKQTYPWRQLRYAEVLLNYAEACIELGDEDEARKYINMIRQRAGMPDFPETESGETLKEHYRNERMIELCYEQQRYFDIRRWMTAPEAIKPAQGIDIRYPQGSKIPKYKVITVQERKWNDKSYLMPIYLSEMQKNNLLVQNPLY